MNGTQKIFTSSEIAAKAMRTGMTAFQKPSVKERLDFNARTNHLKYQTPKVNTDSIDQQIFNDVYSAEDLVLAAATGFIEGPKPFDEKKYARLQSLAGLGFANAEEVSVVVAYDKKVSEYKNMVAAIRAYQQRYPTHKFIDKDGVEQICKKYGLLLSAADKYKADIPEKNQKEIVNFRVMEEHTRYPGELNDRFGFFGDFRSTRANPFYWEDLSGLQARQESSVQGKGIEDLIYGMRYAEDYKQAVVRRTGIPGKNLCILAPERMLNTQGNVKKGHILLNDPIVLQPVAYGYLIVTSWGLEAADPAVFNAGHN